MPVRLGSKLPREQEARIEIIPLIDIMFFLLAAFMLISLKIIETRSLKVALPSARSASSETAPALLILTLDAQGATFEGDRPVAPHELASFLRKTRESHPGTRVLVRADAEARHRQVSRLLDLVRQAGFQEVALATQPMETP